MPNTIYYLKKACRLNLWWHKSVFDWWRHFNLINYSKIISKIHFISYTYICTPLLSPAPRTFRAFPLLVVLINLFHRFSYSFTLSLAFISGWRFFFVTHSSKHTFLCATLYLNNAGRNSHLTRGIGVVVCNSGYCNCSLVVVVVW